MNITEAKKRLYSELKGFNEVMGVGIKERDGMEYIVIYLVSASKKLLNKIPSTFEGIHVEAEVKGKIKAL